MALQFDRDRIRAFGLFVWRRFVDDRCFETAGALSYTTLFAVVPLTAAIFGIITVLPAFNGLGERFQYSCSAISCRQRDARCSITCCNLPAMPAS